MVFKAIIGAICTCLAVASFNANAVVVNTLNGVDYEWLELTATAGMNRTDVDTQLSDVNSGLYGYEYASRALVKDLLLSYSSWDGLNGWHGDSGVVTGIDMFLNDFGILEVGPGDGVNNTFSTVDGYNILLDSSATVNALYGLPNECGLNITCAYTQQVYYDAAGNATVASQETKFGWDSTTHFSNLHRTTNAMGVAAYGSQLVKVLSGPVPEVPVPAAVWLFGSGLLGLIGVARRKNA